MKLKLKLITSAVVFYSLLAYPLFVCGQEKTCTIKGTVINRNSDTLMLLRATDNIKGVHQSIPIINNSFTYTFNFTETEAWVVVFQDEYRNGAYKKIDFFTDTSAVSFKLYPLDESDEKNEINGGKLTRELYARRVRMESLFGAKGRELNLRVRALADSKNYYSWLYQDILRQVSAAPTQDLKRPLYDKMNEMEKSGDNLTPDGQRVKRLIDSLAVVKNRRKYEEIIAAPSLAGYYEVWRDIYFNKRVPEIREMIKEVYPVLAKTFPQHSYTRLTGNELNGAIKIQPEEPFINFSAPDINGKKYVLSEQIKGKVSLIDFWGSWCGPCIAATKAMLPVYREFKEKGFQVVGIAREFKTLNGLKIALKRENYPWPNLVDLNDKNGIWNKYAISANAGMMLLVDASGKIIAVDPTAEEVRKILMKTL